MDINFAEGCVRIKIKSKIFVEVVSDLKLQTVDCWLVDMLM